MHVKLSYHIIALGGQEAFDFLIMHYVVAKYPSLIFTARNATAVIDMAILSVRHIPVFCPKE